MDFQKVFGERVANQRKALNLTQQQLGDMVGLSKQSMILNTDGEIPLFQKQSSLLKL